MPTPKTTTEQVEIMQRGLQAFRTPTPMQIMMHGILHDDPAQCRCPTVGFSYPPRHDNLRHPWRPKGRSAYIVCLQLPDQDPILRERYMTGAEADQVYDGLRRCRNVLYDFRFKNYRGPAVFEKGPGDLLRMLGRIERGEEAQP